MNGELKTTSTIESEPSSTLTTLPLWLVVVMLLLLFWAAVSFDQHGGWFSSKVYDPYVSVPDVERFQPLARGGPDLKRGQYIFDVMVCANCHGLDGGGKPGQAPPLAGSEWVNAEGANRIIRIPLVGLNGPIEVKGQQYNLSMPGVGMLSDEDIAAVLSYVRQAWGNKAPPVTPAQVKAVRSEVGNRSRLYTADELKGLPEK
jgi:mono/diheme cytochrome c family protein